MEKLLLVDFNEGVVGVEDVLSSFQFITTTEEKIKRGEFREVTDTLAACAAGKHKNCEGGWNPEGFHGGTGTFSVIGWLEVAEALFRKRIYGIMVGSTIKFGETHYLIRPCPADLMPIRLYERFLAVRRKYEVKRMTFEEARRICFSLRHTIPPKRVYFSKGTVYVEPPKGAVARVGSSESSYIVFVDKFARPIAAYIAAGDWRNPYPKEVSLPSNPRNLDWNQLRPLGKSTADVLFGVRA